VYTLNGDAIYYAVLLWRALLMLARGELIQLSFERCGIAMERYKHIIPNYDEFLRVIDEPMPTNVRVNTIRITPEQLIERLLRKGFEVERMGWCPYLLSLDGELSAGSTVEHWLGLYYIQEATSLIAPMVLSPKPHEVVLDMCAAPGGKTTHIAMLMQNSGTVVANDPNPRRLRALMSNIFRLSVANCIVTQHDGIRMSADGFKFDKAIVDVPCSAEGNLRKTPSRRYNISTKYSLRISGLQKALLLKAIDLVKVGGIIVYSTCTFAPEENEMVVQHALQTRDVRIEPIEIDVPSSNGLTEWEGIPFHKDMQYALRIYPHHFNSGGGFVALLRKLGERSDGGRDVACIRNQKKAHVKMKPAHKGDVEALLGYLFERFGIPDEAFHGLNFFESSESIWVTSADLDIANAIGNVISVGIRLAHIIDGRFKPTSYALMWLQPYITSSIVQVEVQELTQLLLGQPVKARFDCARGYVAIAFEGDIIGCGFYTGEELLCEMPKGRRAELLDALYCERKLRAKSQE